ELSQVPLLQLRRRVDETFAQRLQSFERRVGRTGNRRVVLPVAAFENPVFAADVFSQNPQRRPAVFFIDFRAVRKRGHEGLGHLRLALNKRTLRGDAGEGELSAEIRDVEQWSVAELAGQGGS